MSLTTLKGDAERVYRDWDNALGRKDVEAAIALVLRRILPAKIATLLV